MGTITNESKSADRIWKIIIEASEVLRDRCSTMPNIEASDLRDIFISVYQTAEPKFDESTKLGKAMSLIVARSPMVWMETRHFSKLNPVEAALSAIAIAEELNDSLAWSKCCQSGLLPNAMPSLPSDLVARSRTASEGADKLDEAFEITGSAGAGAGTEGPEMLDEDRIAKRVAISQALRKRANISAIFDEVGRMVATFEKQDGERNSGNDERDDVAVGRDIANLLPSQFALDDAQFDANFLDGKLQQYETTTNTDEGLGPIIALLDKSGSMSVEIRDEMTRDDFATALALALAHVAKKQRRDLVMVGYSTNIVYDETAKNGKLGLDQLVQLIGRMGGGGTSFEAATKAGLRHLDSLPKADLVFLTDGECYGDVDPKFVEGVTAKLTEHDAKIIGLNIGPAGKFMTSVSTKLHESIEVEKNRETVLTDLFGEISERRKHFLETDWS